MIVAIIDIVSSRKMTAQKRRSLDKKLRKILEEIHDCFSDNCLARPSLTQGDSIELLVDDWLPIIFTFHRLLYENLELRVGLGTGEIVVHSNDVDECDGPIFWNAREALDDIKRAKYMKSSANIRLAKKTSDKNESIVFKSTLFLAALQNLSATQLRYCFHLIWEGKNVTEISKITKTTKGNVSRKLNNTPCYLLESLVSFQKKSKARELES